MQSVLPSLGWHAVRLLGVLVSPVMPPCKKQRQQPRGERDTEMRIAH